MANYYNQNDQRTGVMGRRKPGYVGGADVSPFGGTPTLARGLGDAPQSGPSQYLSDYDHRPAGSLPPGHQGIQTSPFGSYGTGGWRETPSTPNQNEGLPLYTGSTPPWLRTTDHPNPEPGVWNTQSMQEWLQGPGNTGPRTSGPQPLFGGPDTTTPEPSGYAEFLAQSQAHQDALRKYLSGLPTVAAPPRMENPGVAPRNLRAGAGGGFEGQNDAGEWNPLQLQQAPTEYVIPNEGAAIDEWEKTNPAPVLPPNLVNYYASQTRR